MIQSRRQTELDRLTNRLRFRGHVDVRLYDKNQVPDYNTYMKHKVLGTIDDVTEKKFEHTNLVVNAGLAQIILLLNGGTTATFGSCGVGSGTTSPTATDTDLGTAITRISVTNIYQSANVGHWDTFFNASTGNGTWGETGLFTTTTLAAGVMLARLLISPTFTKSTSNTATVAWQITCTAV